MAYAATMAEDENLGSLRSLKLAMISWLLSFPTVTFTSPNTWEEMDFLPEQSGCKDSSTDTPNGTVYNYQVVFAFNKQNAALYAVFAKYLGQVGICQFTDSNGLTRIIGTPEYPVTITHEGDTGQQYRSLNYYKISVTWESAVPAVVV